MVNTFTHGGRASYVVVDTVVYCLKLNVDPFPYICMALAMCTKLPGTIRVGVSVSNFKNFWKTQLFRKQKILLFTFTFEN